MSNRRQTCIVLACLLLPVSVSAQDATECIVPEDQVIGTSVGPDGIPSLTSPEVVEAAAGDDFMFADDLVLGIVINGEARAYPHNVLWWHEVINDFLGGSPVLVTFCPLTASGLVFSPVINNLGLQNFGTSAPSRQLRYLREQIPVCLHACKPAVDVCLSVVEVRAKT